MTAYVLRARDISGEKIKIGSIVALQGGDVARVYAINRRAVSNGSFWIAGARSCSMDAAVAAGYTEASPLVRPIKVVRGS